MIGRLIGGRYRPIAPLGEGGMATLWRAVDEQLDREVAVKILRPQFSADPGFAARFKHEARSAGSLAHPNIVSVYDYGTDPDDDSQYIVMQLVEGEDLASILRERGSLLVDDAVLVAISTASALEAAHRRGIVHRDVKPGNIMITDDGDVKVTDFGIARAVSEASMTVTGTTLGSVHYFSPEQARGDEVTPASDVYALGIVLYEMLTGRRPFEGDSAAGVALRRLSEDPPPPNTFRPVPTGLAAIVMRALAREPAQRYPDAGAFAEALRAWRRDPDGVPVAAAAAGAAAGAGMAAAIPRGGEPTVYVPPPVARPADRIPAVPPRRPVAEERDRQPWWIWLLALLAVLLLGAIGFLGAQVLIGLAPTSTASPAAAQVTIPTNWIGKPLTEVRLDATNIGLKIGTVTPKASDTVANGLVMSTAPAAGTQVDRGSPVDLVVSSGKEKIAVPPLLGQTRDEARASLERVGLALGNVGFEASAQQAGLVIRTNPTAGTQVDRGSTVDIVLSSGPTPTPAPTATPQPTKTPCPPGASLSPGATPSPAPPGC